MRRIPGRTLVVTLTALWVSTLGAAQADAFGPNIQKLHVPFSAFKPRYPSVFTVAYQCCGSGGYVHPVSGVGPTASLIATLDESMLPKGALITAIWVFFYDGTAALDEDLQFELCRSWVDFAFPPGGDCPVILSSTGAPGDGFVSQAVGQTVDYTGQMDGDLPTEEVSYQLMVEFGVGTKFRQYFGDELRLDQIVVFYHLQTSPAGDIAHFQDVPEDDPDFAEVEALYASGIMHSCGAARFCPDAPVTRAQLAVYLARALGLYWGAQ